MPTAVVEADAFTATIQVPNDGEAANQSSLLSNFVQGLTNRTKNIRKGVPGIATTYLYRPSMVASYRNTNARWTLSTSNAVFWTQTSITDGGDLEFEIPGLPAIGTISRVAVLLTGAAAHAGLPAVKPNLYFFQGSTTAVTQLANVADPSGTTTAYQLDHYIEALGLTEPVLAGVTHTVKVVGESGANALTGLNLWSIEVTIIP